MQSGETIVVKGREYSRKQCFQEAVRCNCGESLVWHNLAASLSGDDETATITGTRYTRQQCLMEALRRDCDFGPSWMELGAHMTLIESVMMNGTKAP